MPPSRENLHEPRADLADATLDRHPPFVSLIEELEAIDWYDQRIDAAGDDDLIAILRHNRDEESEHASLLLEWLRRRDRALDMHLRQILFSGGSLAAMAAEDAPPNGDRADGGLAIGALDGKEML